MLKIIGKADLTGRETALDRIKNRSVAFDEQLLSVVAAIVNAVRQRGDAALIEYTAQFDGVQLSPENLRVNADELCKLASLTDPVVLKALLEAISNVRAFHERQIEKSWQFSPEPGVTLGQRITPIERVGVYVPGGAAAYPSSVVMNVVPAQVAGVERIVVVTPPRTLAENPALAAALIELHVNEIYRVGGAQAIAALAFGSQTIPRVDKITGPGNRYVAGAKKLVFGMVGIDSLAGPSEVIIIADDTARAHFISADLLAQAEHGEDASAVLITTSEPLARAVALEVEQQGASSLRRTIVQQSLADYGAIIIVEGLADACAIVNDLAPEHLEIMTADDEAVGQRIQHAGAIFFGSHTPEAVGDYFAGPNHILPTGGAARFSSALGVYDFVKRTSMLRYSNEALQRSARKIAVLAKAEGLDAHARSALVRLE